MVAMIYKWLVVCSLWFMAETPTPAFPGREAKHPFYVAVTEINLNASDKTLEVSCKMFADDLEQIIEKNNHTQLDISVDKDKTNFDKFIPAYVKSHFNLAVDGKILPLSYIGFEKEKESAYCYFQVENISSLKKIDISNSLLHDFTHQQINIMHVTVNGKRQSIKLDYPDKSASFTF